MTTGVIFMSQRELDKVEMIQRIKGRQLTQCAAAKQLGLTPRHLRRLIRRYEQEGAKGLVSKRRGRPSNNRLDASITTQALELIQKHYSDFGPTLACEKLSEEHGLSLSDESVRQLMIKHAIWQGKKRRKLVVHPSRRRRCQRGELVQIDGSPHAWFEGRAPECCLLVFIDDATSELLQLHFTAVESTQGYFDACQKYFIHHGLPRSFYSDRHGIFRVNKKEAEGGTGETQFGRAMQQLDIELICANSPQAKGRVEKANRTLQDRLVKEMRLRHISNITAANDFLPEFIKKYNKRFAVKPACVADAHRLVMPSCDALRLILSHQHVRKVSKNLELSYENVIYQIQSDTPRYTMRHSNVTVCDSNGEITLLYKHEVLNYKTIDKNNTPAQVHDSKEVNAINKSSAHKPKADHPWRRYEKTVHHHRHASQLAG